MSALTPDPVDEMLHSWDCETLSDLERRITVTKGRIEDFRSRGIFSRVEEEEVDLEQLLQTQKDIETILRQRDNQETNIVSTNDSTGTSDVSDDWERICLTPSFDEDAANSVKSAHSKLQTADTSSKNLNGSSLPAVALHPPSVTSITQDYFETKTLCSIDHQQCSNFSLASHLQVLPDCAGKSLSLLHTYFKEESKRLCIIDLLLSTIHILCNRAIF